MPMMECGHAANSLDGEGKPACVICAGIDPRAKIVALIAPDMTGRVARCSSVAGIAGSGHAEMPSSPDLAFFEFRGEGSRAATESCIHCGFALGAHQEDAPRNRDGKRMVDRYGCPGFVPRGPWECDTYYCGCRGWD